MTPTYKHTQIGWLVVVIVGAAIVYCISRVVAAPHPAEIVALVLAALCLFVFSTLTVVADDQSIEARFGPGWIRRRLRWSEIQSARVVRNRWLNGWGIRRIGSGWMFNVSGLDAVELELQGGRRFRIGTDEPGRLHDYVAARLRPPA
jgi:hypothetical protein